MDTKVLRRLISIILFIFIQTSYAFESFYPMKDASGEKTYLGIVYNKCTDLQEGLYLHRNQYENIDIYHKRISYNIKKFNLFLKNKYSLKITNVNILLRDGIDYVSISFPFRIKWNNKHLKNVLIPLNLSTIETRYVNTFPETIIAYLNFIINKNCVLEIKNIKIKKEEKTIYEYSN